MQTKIQDTTHQSDDQNQSSSSWKSMLIGCPHCCHKFQKKNFETTKLSEQSNMTFLSQEAIKLLRDQMATKKAGWCLNPKNANQKANRIKQNH